MRGRSQISFLILHSEAAVPRFFVTTLATDSNFVRRATSACKQGASCRRVPEYKVRSMLGLSATMAHKDGHHPIIFMQCGPMRFRANAKGRHGADRSDIRRSCLRPRSGCLGTSARSALPFSMYTTSSSG